MTHHNLLIVPFEPWHIDVIDLRDEQKATTYTSIEEVGGVENYGQLFIHFAPVVNGEYMAKTGLLDGRVIYCGGLTWDTASCVTAWSLISKDFVEAPLAVKKKVFKEIKKGIGKVPVRRVQGLTDVGNPEADRYLEWFGMEFEGVLKGYGTNGSDQKIYGMVKNEQ